MCAALKGQALKTEEQIKHRCTITKHELTETDQKSSYLTEVSISNYCPLVATHISEYLMLHAVLNS